MKITRKQIRRIILKEARFLKEQEEAFDAIVDINTDTLQRLKAAHDKDGIAGFFDEAARQGVISGKQIWQLATNEQLQQEMQSTLENEGVEAAYVLWIKKLQNRLQ
jgi:hypothetical protein